MSDTSKWPCSQCTYLNYSNAIKCTMCGISKSSPLILEAGADIYQLAERTLPPPLTTPPSKGLDQVDNKWACSACTYLNFEKSQFCTQCRNAKYSLVDHMEALNLKSNQPSSQCPMDSSSRPKNAQGSPPSQQAQKGAGRSSPPQDTTKDSSTLTDPLLPIYKWRCRGCTYENWPRAAKCIMCATQKGSLPQSAENAPPRLATPPPSDTKFIKDPAAGQMSSTLSIEKQICPELKIIKENSSSTNASTISTITSSTTTAVSVMNCESINEINKSKSELQNPVSLHGPSNTNISPNSSGNTRLSSPGSSAHQHVTQNSSQISPLNARSGEGAIALNNYETERILRQFRRRLREADWSWLNACIGVVEGNYEPVQGYLADGGDPMRQLTSADIKILARPSAFDEGHTLVHLAIRFGREDLLATILSRMDGGAGSLKRVPAYVAPDLASEIRRYIASSIRQRKGLLPCHFVTEIGTFALPADIDDLPSSIQEQLFEELLDRDAQKQLEEDSPIINWSLEITDRLGSRLYALWNRTAGDCLLDSLLQASWGVFDRESMLRIALSDSLAESASIFYPRWKENERWQARLLNYYVSESQLLEEWAELLCLAAQPGAALEQLHIFVLAHILRRPIIVYGVKCVKSFRGEDLGFARFEGVYLPFLWEIGFCWKSPLALGYTRGHFCALVPMEPDSLDNLGAGAILDASEPQVVFLPLMTHDAKLLPVHFLSQAQMGCEEELLRSWLEVCVTEGGILVAQQHLIKPPLALAQMTQEWLNHYRRLAQMECAPFSRPISTQGYSSDGDSEEE